MNRPFRNREGRNQPQHQPQQPSRQFDQVEDNSQNRNRYIINQNSETNSFDGARGCGRGRGTGGNIRGNASRFPQENQKLLVNADYVLRPMSNCQRTVQNLANRNRAQQNRDFSISTSHDGRNQGSNSLRSCSTTRSEPTLNIGNYNQAPQLQTTEPCAYQDPTDLLASHLQSQLAIGLVPFSSSNQGNVVPNPFFQTQMSIPTGAAFDQATRPNLINTYGPTMPCATGHCSEGACPYYVQNNQQQSINHQPQNIDSFSNVIYGNSGIIANPSSFLAGASITGNINFNGGTSFANVSGQPPQPTSLTAPMLYCANCGRPLVQCANAASQTVQDGS